MHLLKIALVLLVVGLALALLAGAHRGGFRERLAAFGGQLGVYGIGSEFIELWWVPSLSSTSAPSAAQINAGTRITDDIVDVVGFTTDTNYKEVRTLKGGIGSKLAGRQTLTDSALVFAEHTTYAANVLMQALVEGTDGFIVSSRYKKGAVVATDRVTVWPSRIGGNNADNWPVDDEELRFRVSIGITLAPSKNVAAAA